MNINEVWLGGRLTKDPEVRKTQTGKSVCSFTVAVDRPGSKDSQDDQKQADFINCIAWNGTADYLGNYGDKGSQITVIGRIQTRSYDDQSGQKKYVTEVVVKSASVVGRSGSGSSKRADYGSGMGTSSYSFDQATSANEPLIDQETGDELPF